MNDQTIVPEPLVLTFDPQKSKDKDIRRVYRNKIAWTLWLAIKPSHLTDGRFPDFCLRAAQRIKLVKPGTLSELHHVIKEVQHPIAAGYLAGDLEKNTLILQRIFDAVFKNKPIKYRIILPGSKEERAYRRQEFLKGYDDCKAKKSCLRSGPYMTGFITASNNQPRCVPAYIFN